ncbi:helix-turn-helix domain-containing protein [Chryseobacterium sp. Ch-15]|uniref:Helix-turn-helix domain-containing protein n=1 Tax=Chryseobacterium muglaense TaxID=2893752 RepID=A0A9Q3YR36_9FLAO|nr:helix-turn-helix transcriptional regulator [Chryseobacterium muglaense]MBD3904886.1 helix-turn-helix transcriptional regulator [Chryseobacterium muglaense]MCC9034434.1 helix-turn-helix domain-containing protein [Chryseobacterium muglaense]MCM2554541.1 helix-turn-helix domain-containing protein [Chryseobacterium muglaense]
MSFFGANIKTIRQAKGLSQQAFADLFDLNRGVIGAYEEGRSEPKISTLLTVVHYFNLDLDKFLTVPLTVDDLNKPENFEKYQLSFNSDLPYQENNFENNIQYNSLQKKLANIDLIYEFTENTLLLSNYKIGDFLFLVKSNIAEENPETLLFKENGNLKYLSSISTELHSKKEVYKIVGYLSFNQKNILSSILERIEALENQGK